MLLQEVLNSNEDVAQPHINLVRLRRVRNGAKMAFQSEQNGFRSAKRRVGYAIC